MDYKKYTEGESLSAEELEAMSGALIEAKFDREKRSAWEKRLKDEFGVAKELPKNQRRFPFSRLAIAAVIAVVAGLITYSIVLFSTPTYDAIVDEAIENLITIDTYAVVTRGDEAVDAQVSNALNLLKTEKYEESIVIWKALIAEGEAKGTAEYNVALCYLQKESPEVEKAIENLLKAHTVKTVQEEANWALALAYLEATDTGKARVILEEIIRAKAYKYKKAEVLIESL
ncbi:MAG: hypothetical protein AAF611_15350 [Bacteroidota bacterium]